MASNKFNFKLDSFSGGFCPAFWKSTYPSWGNKNHAGKMKNCDITTPTYMTQGKGLSSLTGVSTLFRGILDRAISADTTYGIGGTKLYKLSSTAVASTGGFPHTITGATGESVEYYKGKVYYSYNTSTKGDVGQLTLANTFDDDYMSTVPTNHIALQKGVPHKLLVGGNDRLYIANKNYLSSFDGTILTEQDLDLPDDAVIYDMVWTMNRIFIASNNPDLTGANEAIGSIYVWDGNTTSWEQELKVEGKISSLFVKGGIPFVFYRDTYGISKLAYIDGTQIRDVAVWSGSAPKYYQVTQDQGYIMWLVDDDIYIWGASDVKLDVGLSQYTVAKYATGGGLASPFGTPMVASTDNTNYDLSKLSAYATDGYWKSLFFSIGKSFIDKIRIINETLEGTAPDKAKYDFKLDIDRAGKTITKSITTGTVQNIPIGENVSDGFRVEFSGGVATNNYKVNNLEIEGHRIQ